MKQNNAINVLFPYRLSEDLWVYDDKDLNVKSEAFIIGSSEVINHLVGMDCNKFTCFISSKPMPEYVAHIKKIKGREQGWYRMEGTGMEHWLCSKVLDYFPNYPKEIFINITK